MYSKSRYHYFGVLVRITIVIFVLLLQGSSVFAATYTWTQTDWSGGLDGGSYPAHPGNRTGWTKYFAKDAPVSASAGGVTIASINASTTQQTDIVFNAGTYNLTVVTGTGSNASVVLANQSQANTWSMLASSTIGSVNDGGALADIGGDLIYSFLGGGSTTFGAYSISGNSWISKKSLPEAENFGSLVYPGSGDYLYALAGNNKKSFYRYSISSDTWTALASTTNNIDWASTLSYPGSGDYIYALGGTGGTAVEGACCLYKYSISGNAWSTLANPPDLIGSGISLTYVPSRGSFFTPEGYWNDGYAPTGTAVVWKYSTTTNAWSVESTPPGNVFNGSVLVYPGTGSYSYALFGGGSKTFYAYSNGASIWTSLPNIPVVVNRGGAMTYSAGTNSLYSFAGGGSVAFMKYSLSSGYYSSGTYTSSVIDTGQASAFDGLSWTGTTTTGTSLKFQLRTASTSAGLASAPFYGPTSTSDFYTSGNQALNAIHAGDRYIQYKAYLSTTNLSQTPSLASVTLTYHYYPSNQTITSSAYNSSSSANALSKIQWATSIPASSTLKFQIRSAPDSAGTPGTFGAFMGPDGTALTYFTDSSGGTSMPTALATTSNNQWFQYRMYVVPTITSVPNLTSVTMTYVVNASPDFDSTFGTNGVAVSEVSDPTDPNYGKVRIQYRVRDIDTTTGSVTPGYITPSFQYNTGSGWVTISSGYLGPTDLLNKAVQTSTYTTYTAIWDAKSQMPGTYTSTAQVRVTANDNEAANNIAQTSSALFVLDTANPNVGGIPLYIDETQSPPLVTVSASDDSALFMRIGKRADLSDASFTAYTPTTTLSVQSGDTVYVQFRDAYGNTSPIFSVQPPIIPAGIFYQDISNALTSDWRLFFAWGVISQPNAGFKRYDIYRSMNGGAFSLLTTIGNRQTNYLVDAGLSNTVSYGYKVAAEDLNGNISGYSTAITKTPNGIGGTDLTPPTLTSVTVSTTTTTGATVNWSTNKLSNSTVYYVASTTYPGTDKTLYTRSAGASSMTNTNAVVLTGLIPNTQYYFLVQSVDASGNVGSSANPAYTFLTNPGPVISGTTVTQIYDTGAKIVWLTNVPANSVVVYSTNADMSSPTTIVGSDNLTSSHTVPLTGLTKGTRYYYYVSSTDGSHNTATDMNVSNGAVQYYNLLTTNDTQPPVITTVSAALVGETGATIAWTTDKPSTSQIIWSLNPLMASSSSTTETSTYTLEHAVVLNNLSTSTRYFYAVASTDQNSNRAVNPSDGTAYSFTTLSPLIATTTFISFATTTVYVGVGGGGGGIMDNRDLTPPVIQSINLNQTGPNSVSLKFVTSKIANGLVDYGATLSYGSLGGASGIFEKDHEIDIGGLTAGTAYHFRVRSSDIYDNSVVSSDGTFVLSSAGDMLAESVIPPTASSTPFDTTGVSTQALSDALRTAPPSVVENALRSLSENSNLASVSDSNISGLISDIAKKAGSSPVIGAAIIVKADAASALIKWSTDKPSNSLVSYADATNYGNKKTMPYSITAGFPDDRVNAHAVTLSNLKPNTTYHYQVRSQGGIGPSAVSKDGIFTTSYSRPDISNAHFSNVSEDTANLTWRTEIPTSADIILKNMKNGLETRSKETGYDTEHSFTFQKLDLSSDYTITLIAKDTGKNASGQLVLPFTTVKSSSPPIITNVKVTASLIPERVETAQTIISWTTDKPSSSLVLFGSGSADSLTESSPKDTELVRDHVVITTLLHPAMVYKIQAVSEDAEGHRTLSNPYTIMTPAPRGSAVDVIFNNLHKTFGAFSN